MKRFRFEQIGKEGSLLKAAVGEMYMGKSKKEGSRSDGYVPGPGDFTHASPWWAVRA